jgi:hypothetical protein
VASAGTQTRARGGPVVPAPARRGVVLAAGALALAGAVVPLAAEVDVDQAPAADAVSAGSTAAVLPAAVAAPDPVVLGPEGLDRTVQRAQAHARRLADAARARAGDERERADEERRTAERARRAGRAADPEPAAKQPAARAVGADCGLDTGALGPVKPYVRSAAEIVGCAFGKPEVLGVAARGGPSDHPKGRALDFVVDRATGDALAACVLENREALGVSYVIWRQRIDTGSGFRPMPDRGSETANHFDHVHVSFGTTPGTGAPVRC